MSAGANKFIQRPSGSPEAFINAQDNQYIDIQNFIGIRYINTQLGLERKYVPSDILNIHVYIIFWTSRKWLYKRRNDCRRSRPPSVADLFGCFGGLKYTHFLEVQNIVYTYWVYLMEHIYFEAQLCINIWNFKKMNIDILIILCLGTSLRNKTLPPKENEESSWLSVLLRVSLNGHAANCPSSTNRHAATD